ncbi:baseplate assembly protein, partial [Klebsiella pneumoniae]
MSRFVDIDLSQLPPPQLIDTISFEDILAQQKADVLARWAEVRRSRPDLPPIDTLMLETEPITLILEATSYRETLLRALVNDKARATLLAFAKGSDLDQIGALFDVRRMPLVDGPRPFAEHPEDWEADERYRRRVQLAPEAFSTAGPAGAYVFHALSASIEIFDAHAFSPADGRVTVVLAGAGGAEVSDATVTAVVDRLDRDDIVPLTDQRSVVRAERVLYQVSA